MRRVLVVVAALIAVVLLSVSGATATTWTDPSGDAKGGPDITAVAVTNDDAGTIAFHIDAALVPNGDLAIIMDTNLNGLFSETTDRVIDVFELAPGAVVLVPYGHDAVGHWVPTAMPSVHGSATSTAVDVAVAKTDLGVTDAFAFWVGTDADIDQEWWSDEAPDLGAWIYMLSAPAPPPVVVSPVIHKPVAVPAKPVAGKKFSVTFAVTRSDNGKPLTTATMACDPRISNRVVKHTDSFKAGKARLSLTVPKTAKGKSLKVNLTIRSGGQSARTVATFRIR